MSESHRRGNYLYMRGYRKMIFTVLYSVFKSVTFGGLERTFWTFPPCSIYERDLIDHAEN